MERVKGFTIVELLVAMGIFGVLSALAIVIYFQVVQAANRASLVAEVEQAASYAMELMVREIRGADCLEGGGDDLRLRDVNCSETGEIVFRVEGGDLLREETASGTTSVLNSQGTKVVDLVFNLSSSGKSVGIDLTMESTKTAPHSAFKGRITLHETVALREY